MTYRHTILLITADPFFRLAVETAVKGLGEYRLFTCDAVREARNRLDSHEISLILCDVDSADEACRTLVVACRLTQPKVCRIIVGSNQKPKLADKVARGCSAFAVLLKPVIPLQVELIVKRALELSEVSRRHRVLSRELAISMDDDIFGLAPKMEVAGGASRFEKLVYSSAPMAALVAEARQAAKTELPVLITGETGTGKELLARAIHFNSSRAQTQIHVQNCGGMNDDTLHSELFGHVAGAFPGAIADRLGLFRAADGGTVFLDEISEVSPAFQVSLLRFLQEGEVKPLGSDAVQRTDVRIIAATNRPLERLVEEGRFRRDLYYRLKGFELVVPPLRERREDIPVLAGFFLDKYAGVVGRRVIGFTSEVLERLALYDWPGNVRELETEVRRMVAVAEQGGYISSRHLSAAFDKVRIAAEMPGGQMLTGATLKEMVEALERRVVAEALHRHRWNQSRAAQELGLSRVGLANKIRRYNLEGERG